MDRSLGGFYFIEPPPASTITQPLCGCARLGHLPLLCAYAHEGEAGLGPRGWSPRGVRPISERSSGPFAGRTRLANMLLSRNLEPGIPPGDKQHPKDPFPLAAKPLGGKVSQRSVGVADLSCDGWG